MHLTKQRETVLRREIHEFVSVLIDGNIIHDAFIEGLSDVILDGLSRLDGHPGIMSALARNAVKHICRDDDASRILALSKSEAEMRLGGFLFAQAIHLRKWQPFEKSDKE